VDQPKIPPAQDREEGASPANGWRGSTISEGSTVAVDLPGVRRLGDVVRTLSPPERERKPSATKLRVFETAIAISENTGSVPIAYQHSVLCQTYLPYRNPGKEIYWDRDNGFVSLSITAGRAFHPERKWVQLGLPFGPKPRQVLCYVNTGAILQQCPVVDVEGTLASFIKVMRYDHCGRNFRTVKDQIARLAAANFSFGQSRDAATAETAKEPIIRSFKLWDEPMEGQRVFWPRTVTLDDAYFQSLLEHAVPLNAHALAALGHSALALDIYAWLAQRLHRVSPAADSFVTWLSLKYQFGEGFARIRDFRRKFLVALDQVRTVYPSARFVTDDEGMTLKNSPPPIAKRMVQVLGSPSKAS
jgi:hypothetical protein